MNFWGKGQITRKQTHVLDLAKSKDLECIWHLFFLSIFFFFGSFFTYRNNNIFA